MNLIHKANIAQRVFKSLIFGQVPNYAIVYVDGRCNMHCGFCVHAAMDARKTGRILPSDWGNAFKRAKKSNVTYVISIKTHSYEWLEGSAYWESPTLSIPKTKENEEALKLHNDGKAKQRQGV